MYFELIPGLWVSDYKSYKLIERYKIDGIINLTKKRIENTINYSNGNDVVDIINENMLLMNNIVIIIGKIEDLEIIKAYIIKYGRVGEKMADEYINNKLSEMK
jgi:hypothetical protein